MHFKILFVVVLQLCVAGCSTVASKKLARKGVLATIGDEAITEERFIDTLAPSQRQAYLDFKKQHLDRLIAEKLFEREAKKRGLSKERLFSEEVISKVSVTPEEISKFYKKNKNAFSKKKKGEREKEIERMIKDQKMTLRVKEVLSDLANQTTITYDLARQASKTP